MSKFLLGLVMLATALLLFYAATFGMPQRPKQYPDEDFSSSLSFYSNHPEIPVEVDLSMDPTRRNPYLEKGENAHIWLTFYTPELPDDYRWAVLGDQRLAFTAVVDGQTGDLTGRIKHGDLVLGDCEGEHSYAPQAALLGDASKMWIPGFEGVRSVNAYPNAGEIHASLGVELPVEEMREEGVETYSYEIGWFGNTHANAAGEPIGRYVEQCREFPSHGQLTTGPNESFKLSVDGDSARDRVIFAHPARTGEGEAIWEDPSGIVRVTFESETRRQLNAGFLFLAGIMVGLATGLWSGLLLKGGQPAMPRGPSTGPWAN